MHMNFPPLQLHTLFPHYLSSPLSSSVLFNNNRFILSLYAPLFISNQISFLIHCTSTTSTFLSLTLAFCFLPPTFVLPALFILFQVMFQSSLTLPNFITLCCPNSWLHFVLNFPVAVVTLD